VVFEVWWKVRRPVQPQDVVLGSPSACQKRKTRVLASDGDSTSDLISLRDITLDIVVIILCQVLHLRKTTQHPETRVHKKFQSHLPIRLT